MPRKQPRILPVQKRQKKASRRLHGSKKRIVLARSGNTGGHAEAVRTLKRAQRKARVVTLYVEHELTMEQVVERLAAEGIETSLKTVCLDLHEALEAAEDQTLQTVQQLRQVEVRRTLRNDRAIIPLLYGNVPTKQRVVYAGKGKDKKPTVIAEPVDPAVLVAAQTRAHQRLTDSGRYRAELLGLNAPIKLAPTNPTGTHSYGSMDEDALQRAIEEKERLLGTGPVVATVPAATGQDADA